MCNDLKLERINKAREEEMEYNNKHNLKLKREEVEGNFKYDKSVFKHRRSKCSYKSAIDYIKTFYPEIKLSKKKLNELLKESNIIKYAGAGRIGFVSANTFSGFNATTYNFIDMDSVDDFAVNIIYGGN